MHHEPAKKLFDDEELEKRFNELLASQELQLVKATDEYKEDSPGFFPWHLLLVIAGYAALLFLDKIVGGEHDEELEEIEHAEDDYDYDTVLDEK